jgi:hypothetical protein
MAIHRLDRPYSSSVGTRLFPHRARFAGAILWTLALAAVGWALAGCGGGGGSSATASSNRLSRATLRKRAIASARLTRGAFAIAGIGRTITRSPGARTTRLHTTLGAIRRTRDTPPDLDPGTGLYFVTQTDLDGSGREDLFVNAAHQKPAGAFVWMAPVWARGQKDTYPAAIHTDYQITGGDFAGEHGTIDFDATDATGDNGTMHIVMTTHENEQLIADFEIKNGVASARDRCSLPDGSTYTEVDLPQADGGMICTIDFPDGGTETVTMDPDGNSTEVLTGPDGSTDATGTLNMDGTDNINYDDGSQESVNVNTADAGDGGGSGDTGSSDDSSDRSRKAGAAKTRRSR